MIIKTIEDRRSLSDQTIYKVELLSADQETIYFDNFNLLIIAIPDFDLLVKTKNDFKIYANLTKNAQISRFARQLLQIVLNQIGAKIDLDQLLLNDLKGAPLIPEGYKASLSHSQKNIAVIASKEDCVKSLGIDLEQVNRLVNPKIQKRITFKDEYEQALEYFASNEALLRIFSAKEAIYKYMYNLDQVVLGFHDVKLEWQPEQQVFKINSLNKKADRISGISVNSFVLFDELVSVVY